MAVVVVEGFWRSGREIKMMISIVSSIIREDKSAGISSIMDHSQSKTCVDGNGEWMDINGR